MQIGDFIKLSSTTGTVPPALKAVQDAICMSLINGKKGKATPFPACWRRRRAWLSRKKFVSGVLPRAAATATHPRCATFWPATLIGNTTAHMGDGLLLAQTAAAGMVAALLKAQANHAGPRMRRPWCFTSLEQWAECDVCNCLARD